MVRPVGHGSVHDRRYGMWVPAENGEIRASFGYARRATTDIARTFRLNKKPSFPVETMCTIRARPAVSDFLNRPRVRAQYLFYTHARRNPLRIRHLMFRQSRTRRLSRSKSADLNTRSQNLTNQNVFKYRRECTISLHIQAVNPLQGPNRSPESSLHEINDDEREPSFENPCPWCIAAVRLLMIRSKDGFAVFWQERVI